MKVKTNLAIQEHDKRIKMLEEGMKNLQKTQIKFTLNGFFLTVGFSILVFGVPTLMASPYEGEIKLMDEKSLEKSEDIIVDSTKDELGVISWEQDSKFSFFCTNSKGEKQPTCALNKEENWEKIEPYLSEGKEYTYYVHQTGIRPTMASLLAGAGITTIGFSLVAGFLNILGYRKASRFLKEMDEVEKNYDGERVKDEYISEHDKEKNAIRMFEALKKHIGQSVNYKAWSHGSPDNGTDILKNVSYFSNVEIGSMNIPFIGDGSAISEISLTETGEVIYSNPYIESNYDRRKAEDVEESKRKMFGDVIVDKQRSRRMKAVAEKEKAKKAVLEAMKAVLELKKLKYTLMNEGLRLVKPETIEEWLQFADNNSDDGYSVLLVQAVISMMKKLDAGISFEDAEQQVLLELDLFMVAATVKHLSHFAKQGEEYRRHWNELDDVEDFKEKGTVSSARLTLRKLSIIRSRKTKTREEII